MKGLHLPYHRACVAAALREDLTVWAKFLSAFNGISFWREDLRLEAELQVMSDASGSVGFRVYFRGHWCTEEWPQDWLGFEISRYLTVLEFFLVLVAVRLWGWSLLTRQSTFGQITLQWYRWLIP